MACLEYIVANHHPSKHEVEVSPVCRVSCRFERHCNLFLSWSKRPAPSGEAFTQLKYWETHQGVQDLTPEQYFFPIEFLLARAKNPEKCGELPEVVQMHNQWRPPLLAVVDDLLAEL